MKEKTFLQLRVETLRNGKISERYDIDSQLIRKYVLNFNQLAYATFDFVKGFPLKN